MDSQEYLDYLQTVPLPEHERDNGEHKTQDPLYAIGCFRGKYEFGGLAGPTPNLNRFLEMTQEEVEALPGLKDAVAKGYDIYIVRIVNKYEPVKLFEWHDCWIPLPDVLCDPESAAE